MTWLFRSNLVDIAPAQIPVTAWDKIRLLPVITLVVSLIQSRYIQAPADSIRSMRIMSYLIPVIMFLVIYNMPSGRCAVLAYHDGHKPVSPVETQD